MRLELIVFDWDGTLMDSAARIVGCMRAAFSDLGRSPPNPEAARDVIGLALAEALQRLAPDATPAETARLVERYRHHYLVESNIDIDLFEGAREVVEALAASDYLLAVATGKGRQGLDAALESTGLGRLFHGTRCADETFSKPNPAMLMELMDELGVRPSETLMIGDTVYDMQMARNAGTHRLAVGYGVHEPARLLEHEPLGCLSSIRELPDWLEQLTSL